jgi:hypothetical protein
MKSELIESTFNEIPPTVRNAIILLVNVLKVDYMNQFQRMYKTESDVRIFQNRLRERFKGYNPRSILMGYELCASKTVKFMPTVQELIESIETIAKSLKTAEINKKEAERVSAIPPPTITCDPMAMFAEAKQEYDTISKAEKTVEGLAAYHREKLKNHAALLVLSGSHIRKIVISEARHLCQYHGCRSAGAIGSGTRGDGNFYCATHYRMA